ncbi:MAG: ATP-dependent Clp protease ATP-binding subunit [Acidobacteria bacterium]|nr:MAG: ATP-dependent Clp protease ATP-binding subunit [Acidobacteriota bacterium]
MTDRRSAIVPLDERTLLQRLERAAERLGVEPLQRREMEHLVGVVTRCSALLEDVYTDERLRAVLGGDPRRLAALLAAPWFRMPAAPDLPSLISRVRRLPDPVRRIGDQALFDLAITGRSEIHGVSLEELGPKAYDLAADVLELLAADARLREHFLSNRLGDAVRIEDEVEFLHRCAERFDLYSRMLREAGEVEEPPEEGGAPRETAGGLVVPGSEGALVRAGEAALLAGAAAREAVAGQAEQEEEPAPSGGPLFTGASLPREHLLGAYERLLLFAGLDLDRLREELMSIVIDQDEAIETLCDDLALYAVGTQNLLRPGSYFLVGPTGVGKNYLVETLVRLLERQWGLEVPLLTIEGPNYTYPSDINELRGATRGFIRSDEPGLLTEFHKRAAGAPLAVILVDEVEKAHPQLRRFFLSIMDRGTTTDAHGNELNFAGTLIFYTSNIGYKDRGASTKPIGFGGDEERQAAYRAELSRALKKTLSPEFINRLKIVRFRHLGRDSAARILRLEFEKIAVRYRDIHGIELRLSPAAEEHLLDRGYSPEYGARRLAALLQRHCNVEVGKMIRRDERGRRETPEDLLQRVRELKASDKPVDLTALDREILQRARARVPYRGVLIDVEDGRLVCRRIGGEGTSS